MKLSAPSHRLKLTAALREIMRPRSSAWAFERHYDFKGRCMRRISVRFVFSVALLIGWMGGYTPVASAEPPIGKVRVYRSGKMTLDGRQVKIDEMRKGLSDLKKNNGVVWYFGEAGEQEPHPNGPLVLQAIMDNKLPVSMSNKEDFSTVVLQDGTIRTR